MLFKLLVIYWIITLSYMAIDYMLKVNKVKSFEDQDYVSFFDALKWPAVLYEYLETKVKEIK